MVGQNKELNSIRRFIISHRWCPEVESQINCTWLELFATYTAHQAAATGNIQANPGLSAGVSLHTDLFGSKLIDAACGREDRTVGALDQSLPGQAV